MSDPGGVSDPQSSSGGADESPPQPKPILDPDRAIAAKDLVSDVFVRPGGSEPVLALAIALPNGPVVYQEV